MAKYKSDPNMMGKRRVFSQEKFDKYDIPARKKVKEALGDFIDENPDIYKQDLVINDLECKYKFIEVQVCAAWVGEKYPYDKLTLYERKSCYGPDTLFLTLNYNFNRGLIFSVPDFKELKLRRIKKYGREFVYDIPWHRVMAVSIDEMDAEVIKMY